MTFLQEMTLAMTDLVQNEFKGRFFRIFMKIFRRYARDQAMSKRKELFHVVVKLYVDMAAERYKPFDATKPMLSDCRLDVSMAKPRDEFVTHAVRCGAHHFVLMCLQSQTCQEDLEMALWSAATRQLYDYVLWFVLKHPRMAYMTTILINALWTPDHCYLNIMAWCFSSKPWLALEIAEHYVRKTLSNPHSWESVSELECLGKSLQEIILTGFTFKPLTTEVERSAVWALVDRCLVADVWSLGVYLPLLMADWDLVISVVNRLPSDVKENYFKLIMSRLPEESHDDTLELIVALLEGSVANITAFSSSCFLPSNLRQLAELCQEEERDKWLLFFTIQLHDWQWVKEFTTTKKNPDVIDMALVLAARDGEWDMVTELVPRSSKAEDVAKYVLTLAVDKLRPAVVEQVLPHVDLAETSLATLLRGTPFDTAQGLGAVDSMFEKLPYGDRHKMLHIMVLLVRQAKAQNVINGAKLLGKLIALKQPAMASLLLRSGVLTLDDYVIALQDKEVREVLLFDDHVRRDVMTCVTRVISEGNDGAGRGGSFQLTIQSGLQA